MEFEWDEQKRIANVAKHRLDFFDAIKIFETPHVVIPSKHSSERRFLAVGMLGELFVTVVYTLRGDAIRIISVRRARHEERREYQALYG